MNIRSVISHVIGRLLNKTLNNIPHRVIADGTGTSPYLSRYYIIGKPHMNDGSSPFDRNGNPKPQAIWPGSPISLYIHHFHRSDVDRELHNHPWEWALSFILSGGYREERRVGRNRVIGRDVLPFTLNWITDKDFHRVDLLEKDAWSLFLTGPKSYSWGFWSRNTGVFTPWREFLNTKQSLVS